MTDFILIFASAIISTIFAFKVCKWCSAKEMVTEINHRSSHKQPTPHGGGLTFVIPTTIFSLLWYAHMGHEMAHAPFILSIILGAPALALLGWVDDKHEISSKARFIIQLIIASIMVYFMPPIFEPLLGFWGSKILILLAWVWFINLYNFMDGINTLAASQAIFLAIALTLLGSDFKFVLLVLAGSCIGFLRVNIHPAKIFMGDVGSLYLGALLGGVMIYQLASEPSQWLLPMLTISLLFTFDATYTLIKRILSGKKPWEAHREHWYQRANSLGWSHEKVTVKAMVINIVLLVLTITQIATSWDIPLFIIALCLMMIIAKYIKIMENK